MNIYDRDGKPMDAREFEKIPAKKRVLKHQVLELQGERVFVLTEWDGKDMSHGEAPVPMPWSTYVSCPKRPNMLLAFPDQHHAMVGHHMMVGFLKSQGCRGGIYPFLASMRGAFLTPRSVKHGWFMVSLFVAVVVMQALTLTASAIRWDWDWSDLFTAALGAAYGYALVRSAQGLKRLRRERKEEQRVEADRKAFAEIVGPLSDRPD